MTRSEFTPTAADQLPRPESLLATWRAAAPAAATELTHQVWRGESGRDVWLLGRNEAAAILLDQGMPCTGVIDDYTSAHSWKGLPVRRFDQVAAGNVVVVNCVQCNQSVEAARRIKSAGLLMGLSFSDFFRAALLPVEALPPFSARCHAALRHEPSLYGPLWDDLRDPQSRQTFADVVAFRLTTDPWFLRNYRYRPDEQYFEYFLALPPAPVFIDAGAFHGETSLEFSRRYPDHGEIHAFEPSDANADILLKQTATLPELKLHRVGLSDEPGIVRFSSQLGSACRRSDDGDTEIEVIRLDDLNLSRADLIKMDLEGGEYNALLGGTGTIQRSNSSLAIAAYHDPIDFARLFHLIKQMLPENLFRIRHYTSGWAETILFCIPINDGKATTIFNSM